MVGRNQFHLATLLTAVLMIGVFLHLNLDPRVQYNPTPYRSVGWPFDVDQVPAFKGNPEPTIFRWTTVRRVQILNLLIAAMGISFAAIGVEAICRHGFRGACARVLFWRWANTNTNVLVTTYVALMMVANAIPWNSKHWGNEYWYFGWPYYSICVSTFKSGETSVDCFFDQDFFGNLIIFGVGFFVTIYLSERLSARLRPQAFWAMIHVGIGLLIIDLLLVARMPSSNIPPHSFPYSIGRTAEYGLKLFQPPHCFNFLIITAIAISTGAFYEYYLRRRDH